MQQQMILMTPEQLKACIWDVVSSLLIAQKQTAAAHSSAPPVAPVNEFINRKEAAQLLGVSLPTLNEWSKTGVITGYRIATRVRYKRSELEQSILQMQTSKQRKAA